MGRLLDRIRSWLSSIPRSELRLVIIAMALSTLLVIAYVVATHPNELEGDQNEYHDTARLLAEGKLWWSYQPFGIPHESVWKVPGYPTWVGFWYLLLGAQPTAVLLLQSIFAAITVALTWALARRLFGPRVAVISAFVVAVFPLVWEWFGLLNVEALAIPLAVLTLLLFLDRPPTTRLALAVGAAIGVGLLIRPSAFFLFAGVAATWILAAGLRRGALYTLLAVGVSALILLPWTVRNYVVADEFVPISMQDMAVHGTFNAESANDPEYPYAWRPFTPEVTELRNGPPIPDAEFRERLIDLGYDYIKEHPTSVLEAFYWNGITRYWDIRRPSNALDEVPFEGRSRTLAIIGLAAYYVMLPLALFALWRHRRRRTLVIPVLAIALAASIVFTTAAATRYRAPLEPLIAILAVSAFVRPQPDATGSPPPSATSVRPGATAA